MKPLTQDQRDLLLTNVAGAQDIRCLLSDFDRLRPVTPVRDEFPHAVDESFNPPPETSSPLSWRDVARVLFDSDVVDL